MLVKILHLITDEFKLVYKLLRINLENFEIKHQLDAKELPRGSIIITDKRINKQGCTIIYVNKKHSIEHIKQRILQKLHRKQKWKVIFGIDPGLSTGLAILSNDRVLKTTIVLSTNSAIQWIKQELSFLKADNIIIRIGDGVKSGLHKRIMQYYREFKKIARIEVVDEKNTSIKESHKITIHEQSAILIARRKGKKFVV